MGGELERGALDLLRLSQAYNCITMNSGYPVEPIDIHASTRHLDARYDILTLTDKVLHAYSLGPERIEDVMEMTRIAAGLSQNEFEARPHMYATLIHPRHSSMTGRCWMGRCGRHGGARRW